ncbi:MAG: desulfoferrodoxin family protein [bacterium]
MDRRTFLRLFGTGIATATITPGLLLANSANGEPRYYTRENPGKWAKKIDGHMPHIEIIRNGGHSMVKVTTSHEMKGFEHYISSHVILDEHFRPMGEYRFNPEREKAPISQFHLGAYRGKINVLSVCNKHDTWLNTATV